MTDYLTTILTACQADTALTTAATGGVYLKRALPGEKLTTELTPTAFTNGYLKPLLIIKGRSILPAALGDADQYQSTRQVIEFWAHVDSAGSYDTLRTILGRVYVLFHRKVLTGGGAMRFQLELEDKDLTFHRSLFIRHDYSVVGKV